MIVIKNLCKKYGEKTLFHDFSCHIPKDKLTIIFGESGTGKSTLLNIIGKLERYDDGEILYDGTNLECISQVSFYRNEVAFLFQNFALVERKTVRQNLELVKQTNGLTIEDALQRVGLEKEIDKKVYKLSGGEQQRVALARVLMKKCNLILADEPTGSLDEKNAKVVWDTLKNLKAEGKTIVLVTHNREFLKEADQIIQI